MSKASELAELASTINVTPSGGAVGADAVAIDSVSIKKLIVTDGRAGNTEFDGGNTAYPAIELLSRDMSIGAKYTPSIKFGSTDPTFTTQNPKFGAVIVAEATQNYTLDNYGGMALSFWTSPNSPGAATSLRERMTIEASGQITVNNSGFLAWTNSQLLFTTAGQGQGARIGKFSDDNLYIENFDDKDIIFRTQALAAGEVVKMHGANGNVSVVTSLTVNNDLSVKRDLYFDSGFGSAAKAYGCRVWANFNGTGAISIRGSGNVSSVTDNGIGRYIINFAIAMPDANYSPQAAVAARGLSNGSLLQFGQPFVNNIEMLNYENNALVDSAWMFFAAFR